MPRFTILTAVRAALFALSLQLLVSRGRFLCDAWMSVPTSNSTPQRAPLSFRRVQRYTDWPRHLLNTSSMRSFALPSSSGSSSSYSSSSSLHMTKEDAAKEDDDSQAASSDDDDTSTTTASRFANQNVYQRALYRFSPGSDVAQPNAVVVEERCRFVPDPDRPDYLLPVGPVTVVLRDGNVEDGELGDEIGSPLTIGTSSTTSSHNGVGAHVPTICTAMYLATNPNVCQGRVLEIACDNGVASVLGCVGAGFVSGTAKDDDDTNNMEEEVLTIAKPSDGVFPSALDQLMLTDSDTSVVDAALQTLQRDGIPMTKLAGDVLDWRIRHVAARRPGDGRGPRAPEYRTVVASDIGFAYPEAKQLARTVANRLEANVMATTLDVPKHQPMFVLVAPEGQDDLVELRRIFEKGYRMTASTHYLKLEQIKFHLQGLPKDTPESALDDLELEVAEFKDLRYTSLTAVHHPDYAGEGSGEIFFPMETGEYDATGGSSFLEKEADNAW